MLSPPQRQESVCQTETPSKTLLRSATPVRDRAGIAPFTFQLQAPGAPGEGVPRDGAMDAGAGCQTRRGTGRKGERLGGIFAQCMSSRQPAVLAGEERGRSAVEPFLLSALDLSLSSPSHLCTGSCCLLALSD